MKRVTLPLIFVSLFMLSSCDGMFTGKNQQDDTTATLVDSLELNKEHTIKGIAVDGSRRNIYVAIDGDTMDFELAPDLDFSWEIGDSIMVKYVTTEYGDSVTYINNEINS